jgi:hypothetical protein
VCIYTIDTKTKAQSVIKDLQLCCSKTCCGRVGIERGFGADGWGLYST